MIEGKSMIKIKSSQNIFMDTEVATLTGIWRVAAPRSAEHRRGSCALTKSRA